MHKILRQGIFEPLFRDPAEETERSRNVGIIGLVGANGVGIDEPVRDAVVFVHFLPRVSRGNDDAPKQDTVSARGFGEECGYGGYIGLLFVDVLDCSDLQPSERRRTPCFDDRGWVGIVQWDLLPHEGRVCAPHHIGFDKKLESRNALVEG